jgi:hypothetical protein
VTSDVVKDADAKPSQVYRTERRVRTPGKLRRLIDRLEDLNEVSREMPRGQLISRMQRAIGEELEALRRELTEEEMRHVLNALKFENLPPLDQIPRLPQRKEVDPMQRVAVGSKRRRRNELQLDYVPVARSAPPHPRKLIYHKQVFVAARITHDEGVEVQVGKNPPVVDLFR